MRNNRPRFTEQDLTPAELAELTAASDQVDFQGDRYPEHMQRWINR